jgi:hypothetical protein
MTRSLGLGATIGATEGAGGEEVPDDFPCCVSKRIPRHITIDIPAPCDFINSNMRLHRMAQAKLTKTWRQASAAAAHGIPQFAGQVHITAHIFKPRGGRYDTNNLAPTTKAIVDGLVDAGLLIDDSREFVIGPDHRHGGKGNAEIVLEIIELGGANVAQG